jgi:alkylated DNA repair dioxygenase AlkB
MRQSPRQGDLFVDAQAVPEGFALKADIIDREEEQALVSRFASLPFRPFEFHGFLGKRQTVSFGWRYDFGNATLQAGAEIPAFLLNLRDRAAAFADLESRSLVQALVTQYAAGSGIGWHRDKTVFGEVLAFSFLAECRLRFRRKSSSAWQRAAIAVPPRSLYLLRGAARDTWYHSIPPVAALRYSVTFRTLA